MSKVIFDKSMDIKKLEVIAKDIRKEVLTMVYQSKSGHLGCSLGIVDILIALYFNILRVDPKKPSDKLRDRFLLSKGHASSALYAILATRGFFPKSLLTTYLKDGSKLAGHVTWGSFPGIEATAGSLGHGLSIGLGMSLAIKQQKVNSKVYVLIGDGECAEGSIWEGVNFAGHHKINNLILIIDNNNLQIMGWGTDILNSVPFENKFKGFGWDVESVDGHNIELLSKVLQPQTLTKPLAVITNTIKGKGVSFMENKVEWHGKCPNEAEYKLALQELS